MLLVIPFDRIYLSHSPAHHHHCLMKEIKNLNGCMPTW